MGNLSYPHLGSTIPTFICDAETEFPATVNENYVNQAVWGTTRGETPRSEAAHRTWLKTHLKSHSVPTTIMCLESTYYKSNKPENKLQWCLIKKNLKDKNIQTKNCPEMSTKTTKDTLSKEPGKKAFGNTDGYFP